ncbi:hypothetical protein E4O03_07395 [Treponema sp. OMZ 792]|uniref:hypothetical protein n=1 Tax=unclassified Treponema TaxID=2638727 RepID=UPI0020A61346|nr:MULTISPECIES: hypothetical protein [unclassified Treponema]UTC74080.1 hypothetical protein E4O03_07395 [Treponema sp. OMZ 792]UTC77637.1 hypothetical protein E4O04_06350 [Treponema sp. OMZ 799]UTC80480.1 hypothetical protein E4O07_07295 [Treponema sp. OMZ 798]
MKRFRTLFYSLIIFLNLFNLHSQDINSYAKILYDHDSPYYDDLHLMSLENGSAMLSYKKPLSFAEIALFHKEIEPEHLSKHGEALYGNLNKLLFKNNMLFSHDNFSFNANLILALQGQYFYNPDKTPGVDKFIKYNKMPAPLTIPIELGFSKYVYSYTDLIIEKNFSGFRLSYPYTNLPLSQTALDYHFPKKAGLSVGNSFFNVHIGRGRLNVGRTLSGSMLISDIPDRHDYITASLFSKHIKMDTTIAELKPMRFFITHALSFKPVKQFSITVHEGIMLASLFDPKFLNPLMIFHNYAAWKEPYVNHVPPHDDNSMGCQLGVDINIVPIKGLRLYGQFGMNQFQTPSELAGGASYIPNSMGGIAGIEYAFSLPIAYLVLTGEFMYADPWLYIGMTKDISFYTYRKENVYASSDYDKSLIEYWLANPYGPDSITAFLKTSLILPHKYKADFMYRFVSKGENEEKFFTAEEKYYPSETNPAPAKYKTPSGNPTYFHTLQLTGEYSLLKNLHINGGLSWTIAHGKINGHSVDFLCGIIYSIR